MPVEALQAGRRSTKQCQNTRCLTSFFCTVSRNWSCFLVAYWAPQSADSLFQRAQHLSPIQHTRLYPRTGSSHPGLHCRQKVRKVACLLGDAQDNDSVPTSDLQSQEQISLTDEEVAVRGTCVVHEHNLLGVEQLLGNEQGPDDVICHTPCRSHSLSLLPLYIASLAGCTLQPSSRP